MNTRLFINGEFVFTSEKQKVIDPSTSQVIAEVSVASMDEVKSAISGARDAFDCGAWGKISLGERKKFILKIAQGILDKAGDLANLETLNTGKPIKESTFMDIPSSAKSFEYIAEHFEEYLNEPSPKLSAQADCCLKREPMGVVVLIIPWNYPLLIACWKLASALAAGNTVILKPSSLTPLTALELASIIHDAGLPKGVVSVINGPGEKIGRWLCEDKRVDMISFTGSNEVGRRIMEYSSACIKKLTMELGGKSASIILKDADLEVAVNGALCSIFLNQGQMCTAMSRIFVQEEIYDRFLEDFTAKAKRIKLGPGMDFETQMGPLISREQRERVLGFVESARSLGARILSGGHIPDNAELKNGFFFEPTVITEASSGMPILKEEVFGPVVIIGKFGSLHEAVSLANDSDFGLASSIWSRDIPAAQELAQKINAGSIWINTYGMFYDEAPFGGFKQSGFGKELGKQGFLEYTRLKNIITDKTIDAKPLVNYWYGF